MSYSSDNILIIDKSKTYTSIPQIWEIIKNYREIYYEEKNIPPILWASPDSKWIPIKKLKDKNGACIILKNKKNKKIIEKKLRNFNELELKFKFSGKLQKRTFLVVRPLPDALIFANTLEKYGAKAIPFPVLKTKIKFLKDIDKILKEKWDYVIFTSKRGVDAFLKNIEKKYNNKKIFRNFLENKKIITIGPETAYRIREFYLEPIIPEKFIQEGIIELLKDVKRKKILILRTYGRENLKEFLISNKNYVKEVIIYEMIEEKRIKLFIDYVSKSTDMIFTSPKIFETFYNLFKNKKIFENKRIISIGEITKRKIEDKGLKVHIMPKKYSGEYLLKEILKKEV